MANSNRDNFPSKIVEILKKRAAYICSNPNCRKMTVAPSEVADDKVIYIGRASHICAAASGGPRYDASMKDIERSSITNAIFLCSNCADMIDDNGGIDFTVEQLKKWKTDHEKWISDNLNKSIEQEVVTSTVNIATSYNQSGGITANQVTLGTVPRNLSEENKKNFLTEIAELPRNEITLRALFSDAESQSLCHDLNQVFKDAHWTVKGPIFEIPNQPIKNVVLGVPQKHKESKATMIIYNWLNGNNFKVTAELVPDEKGFIIFVGQNV